MKFVFFTKIEMQQASTLAFVVNRYTRRKSIDVIDRKLRSQVDDKRITTLKTVPINNLSTLELSNPFRIRGMTKAAELTQVQRLMMKLCAENTFMRRGSIALRASCGSGKTLTGIYLIHKLKCKTLIISTRNAVKEQWYQQLHELYPQLKIQLKKPTPDADIWILTPQFLNKKNRIESETFDIEPSLIIYDEIHTMLSDGPTGENEFLNVLKYPFIRAETKDFKELPYMLGLSATYPEDTSKINRVFGPILTTESSITDTPIYVYDLRDATEKRGKFDAKYSPLEPKKAIEFFINNIRFAGRELGSTSDKRATDLRERVKTTITISSELKGIVMTMLIDDSAWAALYIHKQLNCNVLLVRTQDEKSYWLPAAEFQDEVFSSDIKLSDLQTRHIGHPCDTYAHISDADVIVSTVGRMREGFSCENLVWGLVPTFPYSQLTRVQIAGRIRRTSLNPKINQAKRLLFTCSRKIPSSLFIRGVRNPTPKLEYSWEFERKLFAEENIRYISAHIDTDSKDKPIE